MRLDPRSQLPCYLYEDFPRAYPFSRIDGKTVMVSLPVHDGDNREFLVQYDERDRRILIAFDGEVPWCGLPKAATQVHAEVLFTLVAKYAHQRKWHDYELPPPYIGNTDEVDVTLRRRFLLLSAGNALIMRYRQHSLAGWYSLVRVFRHADEEVEVDFLTTDY